MQRLTHKPIFVVLL